MTDIKTVGVLGCGLMGSGIPQVAATAGYRTIVREISDELLAKGRKGIETSLGKFVERGKPCDHRRLVWACRAGLAREIRDLGQR